MIRDGQPAEYSELEVQRRKDQLKARLQETSFNCICQLQRKHCQHDRLCEQPPRWDHQHEYIDKVTGERVYTLQPYIGTATPGALEGQIREHQEYAREHHLTVRASVEDSWWFPGETVLIEYRSVKRYIAPPKLDLKATLQQEIYRELVKHGGVIEVRRLENILHLERYGTTLWFEAYDKLLRTGVTREEGTGVKTDPKKLILLRLLEN